MSNEQVLDRHPCRSRSRPGHENVLKVLPVKRWSGRWLDDAGLIDGVGLGLAVWGYVVGEVVARMTKNATKEIICRNSSPQWHPILPWLPS